MQHDPEVEQIKAEMLALVNEMRAHTGKPSLKAFPEQSCAFCGRPEEEIGPLYRGELFEFIHICRVCTGRAQRSFIEGQAREQGSGHET